MKVREQEKKSWQGTDITVAHIVMNGAYYCISKGRFLWYLISFLRMEENTYTHFAVLTYFCPEFKSKCVCLGVGGVPLVKGLLRNIVLIELDASQAVLCMPKPGISFCFKSALERRQTMGVIAFVSCL